MIDIGSKVLFGAIGKEMFMKIDQNLNNKNQKSYANRPSFVNKLQFDGSH